MGAPRILFHARGTMSNDECTFYRHLRSSVEELGGSFFLVGHHLPVDHELPFFRVPNGVQRVAINSLRDSFIHDPDVDWSSLLELDQQWNGQVKDEEDKVYRVRSLSFFQGYYQILLDYVQPSLVVVWNGEHPQDKILVALAKKNGCRIGYVERGPIPYTIQYDSEGVLAASSFAKQPSLHWSDDVDSRYWVDIYKKIESNLLSSPKTWWNQPKNCDYRKIIDRLGLDPEKPVLLFAGQVDRDVQTLFFSPHFINTSEALKWTVQQLSKFPDWQLLGKQHPQSKTSMSVYKSIVSGRGVWVDDLSLEDAFGLSSGVVAINSTVLYEGMMRGIPGLSLGQGLFSDKKVFYEFYPSSNDLIFEKFLLNPCREMHQNNFDEMMANLLSFHLYDFAGSWDKFGAKSANDFAKSLVDSLRGSVGTSERCLENLEILRMLSDKSLEPTCFELSYHLIGKIVRRLKGKFIGLK
jgi:hypothetical protein